MESKEASEPEQPRTRRLSAQMQLLLRMGRQKECKPIAAAAIAEEQQEKRRAAALKLADSCLEKQRKRILRELEMGDWEVPARLRTRAEALAEAQKKVSKAAKGRWRAAFARASSRRIGRGTGEQSGAEPSAPPYLPDSHTDGAFKAETPKQNDAAATEQSRRTQDASDTTDVNGIGIMQVAAAALATGSAHAPPKLSKSDEQQVPAVVPQVVVSAGRPPRHESRGSSGSVSVTSMRPSSAEPMDTKQAEQ